MKYLKTYKIFEDSTESYSVGDMVMINYWVTGEPTPVKIVSLHSNKNGKKMYTVSFKIDHNNPSSKDFVQTSQVQNAPDISISASDIITRYSSVQTPAGPGFIATNPGAFNSQQVSNDLYL